MDAATIQKLKDYFAARDDVSMAFLFGSQAKGTAGGDSDTDIGVYFKPEGRQLEWEETKEYPATNEVWSAVDVTAQTPTSDIVVLNRAPSILAANILENGIPLVIKDARLFSRLWLAVTDAAEEFRQIKEDWRAVSARSQSITYFDKERLLDRIEFMESELQDLPKFERLSYETYRADRDMRRNVERWVENIVNASIDIAKILLASEKKATPMKYAEALSSLGVLADFPQETADRMSEFAKTRNWLAHEYPDMSFDRVENFIKIAGATYPKLVAFARKRIQVSQ